MKEQIAVVDYGSQTTQLIVREVRKLGVFAYAMPAEKASAQTLQHASGIILSGGPNSVHGTDALLCDPAIFTLGKPVLGICYGHQLMAHMLGGSVDRGERGEYGKHAIDIRVGDLLFKDVPRSTTAWMNHFDVVRNVPPGFTRTATTENGLIAAMHNREKRLYSVQFHPEVQHTPNGPDILRNFIRNISGCTNEWKLEDAISQAHDYIGRYVDGRDVISFISGGVDSTVATTLAHDARKTGQPIGRIYKIHIDNGLMREQESRRVVENLRSLEAFRDLELYDASESFLKALKGVTEPEKKRLTISQSFVEAMRAYMRTNDLEDAVLCQGTIHPDLVESGHGAARASSKIKSHHNVSGEFIEALRASNRVVEPNRELFKDEVRDIGKLLGVPDYLVQRQPFPGPGLAIRIVDGEVTPERLAILRRADAIFLEEVEKAGFEQKPWQYFAALLNCRATGQQGDERRYGHICALRAVKSRDAMTADNYPFPHEFAENTMRRITGEIPEITRVVVDITSKPPGTIEFE